MYYSKTKKTDKGLKCRLIIALKLNKKKNSDKI